jgi:hypothetical protein
MWIEPRGFSEIHTRGATEQHRLQAPEKWVPYGIGAIEGEAAAPPPALEAGTNGSTPEYGPGEEPRPPEGAPTGTANHELL